jgi:hypothetical protein
VKAIAEKRLAAGEEMDNQRRKYSRLKAESWRNGAARHVGNVLAKITVMAAGCESGAVAIILKLAAAKK